MDRKVASEVICEDRSALAKQDLMNVTALCLDSEGEDVVFLSPAENENDCVPEDQEASPPLLVPSSCQDV